MFEFRQYIIAVTTAAVVGSIAIAICDNKGTTSAVVKVIVGVFMTFTVIKPLINIKIADISEYLSSVNVLSSEYIEAGSHWAEAETSIIIKDRTEAYILDKASAMGLQIGVDVSVDGQIPFVPFRVTITGVVPPYAKNRLSQIIETDIGVSKENQIWNQ